MLLDILIIRFQKDQKHKVNEIVGYQVWIANIVDYTIEDDISQLQHAVSQQFDKKLITFFSDFIEPLAIDG